MPVAWYNKADKLHHNYILYKFFMGSYCASGKPFVLVVVSWPGLLIFWDNLNVIVNIIGQINECLSSEFWYVVNHTAMGTYLG